MWNHKFCNFEKKLQSCCVGDSIEYGLGTTDLSPRKDGLRSLQINGPRDANSTQQIYTIIISLLLHLYYVYDITFNTLKSLVAVFVRNDLSFITNALAILIELDFSTAVVYYNYLYTLVYRS